MTNLTSSAYPLPLSNVKEGEIIDTKEYCSSNGGFTKLELATLMIAQSYIVANSSLLGNTNEYIAQESLKLAIALLAEANK